VYINTDTKTDVEASFVVSCMSAILVHKTSIVTLWLVGFIAEFEWNEGDMGVSYHWCGTTRNLLPVEFHY
jgi:hypothetical protein